MVGDDDRLFDSCVGNNGFILLVDKNSFVVGDGKLFLASIDDVDKNRFVFNDSIMKQLRTVLL